MITENNQPASELVTGLCKTLNTEGINYCHWKSNAAIDRSASGENDLDLLVSRTDAQRFIEILIRLGFKEACSSNAEKLPGVRDFYGYDKKADRIIHVHAHFQLVLGNDLSKNYRIPIESPYLGSATREGLFRLPAPEFELAILVIRLVIKHSTLDTIMMRHGDISTSERMELEFLRTRSSEPGIAAVFEQHLPYIDRNLFEACLRALEPGASFWKRISAGRQLQQKLKSCARRPQIADLLLKFTQRVKLPIQSRLHMHMPKKSMANGGLLIAKFSNIVNAT